MKKYFLSFAIIASCVSISGCMSVDEQGHSSDWNDGYEVAMMEIEEKEIELENAKECINLLNEQISDIDNSVNSISSDLKSSLSGNYYDLYDAADRASDDLDMIWFLNPCN